MDNRSAREGSLPARLRYVNSQSQDAHSAWCRSFKRYMRQVCPVGYQMMAGQLTEPKPLPATGSSAATPYVVSSDEDRSSSRTSSDEATDTDPVGRTIPYKSKAELQDAATAVPDAGEQPGTPPTPDDSLSRETEKKKGEPVAQRRDSAGRFLPASDAGDGPPRLQPQRPPSQLPNHLPNHIHLPRHRSPSHLRARASVNMPPNSTNERPGSE